MKVNVMVDPVSLAVVSGASMFSVIIGRLSKNKTPKQETSLKNKSGKLQFINLSMAVDPSQFIPDIDDGKSLFINIKSLFPNVEQLSEFLYNLEITAKRHDLALKQISSELLLLTNKTQLMRAKTVSQAVNRDASTNIISTQNLEIIAG